MANEFNLSDNAVSIFKKLYCFNGESISDTFIRVAKEFSTNDEEFKIAYDLLSSGTWRPNTPVFMNAGTKNKIFSACFISDLEDSMESIYDIANVARRIFQRGAGIGIPIGNLREKDAWIFEKNDDVPPEGKSSGPVTFLELYDAVGQTTKSGGRTRRAALLGSMPIWHPDIIEFIKCKNTDEKLRNMNISVMITDKFMQALEDNVSYQLISPHKGQNVGELPASQVWDEICKSSHKNAEPGILFIDEINRMNPLKKKFLINATNPCVIGDSLIAVADGRNAVNLKQLAIEGNDVPVYSTNIKTDKIEIKWGRNPRKTGTKKEVWKVKLDDDSELIATPDHKFLTRDLSYVKLKDLKVGQLLPEKKTMNPGINFTPSIISEQWQCNSNNHKVVSIEFYGHEDVYNITVDDNHNYHIITSHEDDRFIRSSGLCVSNCGEIPGIPFDCCQLSAINVSIFVKEDKTFDFNKLYNTTKKITRLMDNLIDKADYPDKRFETTAKRYRQIGIGLMGLSDTLQKMKIPYASKNGRTLASNIMKTITTASIDESTILAQERGTFHDYKVFKDDVEEIVKELTDNNEEILEKVKKHGLRASRHTTIAPTGTVAISCDASYGMEPCFGLTFRKKLITGEEMVFVNPIFQEMCKNEKWYNDDLLEKIIENNGSLKGLHGIPKEIKDIFVVAHDINFKDRIDMQATLQKHTSAAISSTINLPEETTREEISELFRYAYKSGLKGVTIYRNGTRKNQPIEFRESKEKQKIFKRPKKLPSMNYMVETGEGKMYISISEFNSNPVELFLNIGKGGQSANTFSEALGRLISIMLQKNISIDEIVNSLIGINSDKPIWYRFEENDQRPAQILSIPDGLAQLLQRYYLKNGKDSLINSEVCPMCKQRGLQMLEGCTTCTICNYSRCS